MDYAAINLLGIFCANNYFGSYLYPFKVCYFTYSRNTTSMPHGGPQVWQLELVGEGNL